MRKLFYIGLILLLSCKNNDKGNENNIQSKEEATSTVSENINIEKQQICWKGKLNSKTNILLHYQVQDDLIIGQILYLDTKEQKPIRIIGTIEEDNNFRLLEFDKTGNITGIITGLPNKKEFNGSWFSPKTKRELKLNLIKIDTVIKYENTVPNLENVEGEYYYQYSEAGYQGNLTIKKISQNKISFNIISVTSDPSRNIADIETDTVTAQTDFIYKVPETDSCEFRIRFFKDFAYINYTKGYCDGIFGHNATVDGIFYKLK